jgi:hypothetical protein
MIDRTIFKATDICTIKDTTVRVRVYNWTLNDANERLYWAYFFDTPNEPQTNNPALPDAVKQYLKPGNGMDDIYLIDIPGRFLILAPEEK